MATAWAILIAGVSCLRAWALFASAFDLGYFTQALGQVGRAGLSATASLAGWTFFQDHLSILALPLAPLARTRGGPYWLLIIQAIVVASSIPLVWRLVAATAANLRQQWAMTIAYSVAPTLLFALWFDFHPTLLALPFLLMLAIGIEEGDPRLGVAGAILASLAREDVALVVVVICLVFFSRKAKWLAVGGLSAMAIGLVGLLVTGGGGAGWFLRAGFSYVDAGDPWSTLGSAVRYLWSGGLFMLVVVSWLLPWIGWRRLSVRPLLVALVASLPYLLSAVLTVKVPGWHYYFFWAPLGLWSVARSQRSRSEPPGLVEWGAVAVAFAIGPFAIGAVAPFTPVVPEVVAESYSIRGQINAAHAAISCVPSELSQSIANPLVPFAANRPGVSVWPMPFHDLLLIEGLVPILEAPPGGTAPAPQVVVTGAQELDRLSLFPEFVDELPAMGYRLLEGSPVLADVWVLDEEIGKQIERCLTASSVLTTELG